MLWQTKLSDIFKLQELMKNTDKASTERDGLEKALEAMQVR